MLPEVLVDIVNIAGGDQEAGQALEDQGALDTHVLREHPDKQASYREYALKSHDVVADDAATELGDGMGLEVGVHTGVLDHHAQGDEDYTDQGREDVPGEGEDQQADAHQAGAEHHPKAQVRSGLETGHINGSAHGSYPGCTLKPAVGLGISIVEGAGDDGHQGGVWNHEEAGAGQQQDECPQLGVLLQIAIALFEPFPGTFPRAAGLGFIHPDHHQGAQHGHKADEVDHEAPGFPIQAQHEATQGRPDDACRIKRCGIQGDCIRQILLMLHQNEHEGLPGIYLYRIENPLHQTQPQDQRDGLLSRQHQQRQQARLQHQPTLGHDQRAVLIVLVDKAPDERRQQQRRDQSHERHHPQHQRRTGHGIHQPADAHPLHPGPHQRDGLPCKVNPEITMLE